MSEETPTNNPSTDETPTNNLSTEETPTKNSSTEQTSTNGTSTVQPTAEIVANPEFITWKYPPYCELCNVYFSGEACSKLHFEGRNHKNRLHTWQKYQDPESLSTTNSKNVLCNICWKEMNTQKILDTHSTSPVHLKEVNGRLIVQKLKEEYRQLKELHTKK